MIGSMTSYRQMRLHISIHLAIINFFIRFNQLHFVKWNAKTYIEQLTRNTYHENVKITL